MPLEAPRWTADAVRALPDDGRRYELVSGALVVTPAPRAVHQLAVSELLRRLDPWVRAQEVGHVLFSPADLALGEDEVLQPDLFVYPTNTGRPIRDWTDITQLLLVVEVASPSTARYDRTLKRLRYQRAGVPEYWVLDTDARLVERWRPGDTRPEIITDRLDWQPPGASTLLQLDLTEYFEDVTGEP